jgi:hypothetical protein
VKSIADFSFVYLDLTIRAGEDSYAARYARDVKENYASLQSGGALDIPIFIRYNSIQMSSRAKSTGTKDKEKI